MTDKHDLSSYDFNRVIGLQNIGNTCYMNSGLQIIVHATVLSQFIIKNTFTSPFLNTYQQFLQHYFTSTKPINPHELKNAISTYTKHFKGNHQEDSHEFIVYLLDVIEEELKKEKLAFQKFDKNELISILFDTIGETSIQSLTSDHHHTKTEKIRYLSLPVVAATLEECFEQYQQDELLTGENKWLADESSKLFVDAKKTFSISHAPKYLIFQLKRYTFVADRIRGRRGIGSKNSQRVVVPPTMFVNDREYSLRGFVLQSGSLNGGHYTSGINKSGQWFYCNDSSISKMDEKHALDMASQSYLMFYYLTR
jgi:ubiquitin C-terminal hydrolase